MRLRNDHAQAHRCNAALGERAAKTGGVAAEEAPASGAAAAAPSLLEAAPEAAARVVEVGSREEPGLETSDDEDVAWEDDEEADAEDSRQWLQAFSGLTTADAGAAVSAS